MKYKTPVRMKLMVSCAFMLASLFSAAQKNEIDSYFAALRNSQAVNEPSLNLKKEDQYVNTLSQYLNDTVSAIRAEAYSLLSRLGQQAKQKTARKNAVKLLLRGWRDANTGIHGLVANSLARFQLQDFDRQAIDTLENLIRRLPPKPGSLFKLAGFLGLHEQAAKIKARVEEQQPPLPSRDRWDGYLALARLGDQHALDVILNRVRTFGINDDIVYEVFPDLVYTRAYRAIHYLEEVVFSNDENCSAPNANTDAKINCAYRVIELLAPAIVDYPLATGITGDLVEEDYGLALEKVRDWFRQKDGTYEIIRDTY